MGDVTRVREVETFARILLAAMLGHVDRKGPFLSISDVLAAEDITTRLEAWTVAAEQRGAEAMRERAAQVALDMWGWGPGSGVDTSPDGIAAAIRALPPS